MGALTGSSRSSDREGARTSVPARASCGPAAALVAGARPSSREVSVKGMLSCMRTTIELNDELLRAARRRAADDGTSVRAVVEAALRGYLGRSRKAGGFLLNWRTERGRLQPGVRIEDRDALFDLMGGRR